MKPVKMKLKHPELPDEMLLFRSFEDLDSFLVAYPSVNAKRLGRLCIAMFRGTERVPNAEEYDYLGIGRKTEEGHEWFLFFEKQAEVVYLGGIALGAERQRAYHAMLRANGFQTSMDKFGWCPQVIIDDEPSEAETEAYVQYLLSKGGDDLHADLQHALEEDFED